MKIWVLYVIFQFIQKSKYMGHLRLTEYFHQFGPPQVLNPRDKFLWTVRTKVGGSLINIALIDHYLIFSRNLRKLKRMKTRWPILTVFGVSSIPFFLHIHKTILSLHKNWSELWYSLLPEYSIKFVWKATKWSKCVESSRFTDQSESK